MGGFTLSRLTCTVWPPRCPHPHHLRRSLANTLAASATTRVRETFREVGRNRLRLCRTMLRFSAPPSAMALHTSGYSWKWECFCGNSYHNGFANNNNHADCPGGECDITNCDGDGVLDPDGTASLCANDVNNCGQHNAVYFTEPQAGPVFEYVGCYRDNEGQRDLPVGSVRVTAVPLSAANECAAICDGYTYFGLQWKWECFCGNSYHNGYANNNNHSECPGGECPTTSCDADGTIDADGTASLCANDVNDCGNKNA